MRSSSALAWLGVALLVVACLSGCDAQPLREMVRDRIASQSAKAGNPPAGAHTFLDDVEGRYALYPVVAGGFGLPEALGRASEAFVGDLLERASAQAAARDDALVRRRDVAAALNEELPSRIDADGMLTFFPSAEEPDRVSLASADLASFRDSSMPWRLLDAVLEARPAPSTPLEPSAAEALADAVSRHAVLVLRLAGKRAGEDDELPFIVGFHIEEAADDLRRRSGAPERTGAAPDPTAEPEGGALSTADRLHYAAWGIDPDDPEVPYRYGSALLRAGRVEPARKALQRALELEPRHPGSNFAIGEVLLLDDDAEGALAHFERVVAEGPSQFRPAAHTRIGRILARTGRPDEALEHFQEAVALNADQPEAHFNLGISLRRHDRPEDAAAEFARAVELDPDFIVARRQLGQVLAELGRFEEAIPHYEFLIEANHRDPVALYELAVAVETLGDPKSARKLFERSLTVARSHPRYAAMVRDLEEKLAGSPPEDDPQEPPASE